MTDRISTYETGPATTFYLECDRVGQDINGNYTTLAIYLRAVNGPGATTGSYFGGSGAQYAVIDGYGTLGSHGPTSPFMPSGYSNGATRWRDGPWYANIGHNADGSRGAITLRMQTRYSGHDRDATASFNDFPTIPRASQPSLSSGTVDAGTSVTINTNRASTSFTHNIYYEIGSVGATLIASGVTNSTSWTPPLSLLSQIPNAPTGVVTIRCNTFSGSTYIGQKTVNLTLNTPSSVIPTWSSVTVSEDTTAVTTYVGAYVQNVSKLDFAINGAAGVYGSTISLRRFTAAGQTVDAASGTTPNVISSSGTVPVTWLIKDSRGKQKTQTSNITVLPYVKPVINSYSVQRCLSDGTLSPDDGTYLKITLNAAVQSLMNSTQRNIIQIKVRSRTLGSTTAWTNAATLKTTINPAGITYNTSVVVAGPYAVTSSYEVRVEVLDRFNMSSKQLTIPVGAIFMHWAENGLGVGKYRENGMLDVGGDIYTTGALYPPATGAAVVTDRLPHSGTASQRNTYYGSPSTDAARVALANREVAYYNVDTGWWESYFATTGLSGLTAEGLVSGTTSGWFPLGRGPMAKVQSDESGKPFTGGADFNEWRAFGTGESWRNTSSFTLGSSTRLTTSLAGRYSAVCTMYFQDGTGTGVGSIIVADSANATIVESQYPVPLLTGYGQVIRFEHDQVVIPSGGYLKFRSVAGTWTLGQSDRANMTLEYLGPPLVTS